MPIKACVSVGVARPEGLPQLPGAVTAAEDIAAWAQAAGFRPWILTDADAPVTIDRLRAAFTEVFADPAGVDHLIVFFAGHGVSRDAEDQLLLLSNWRSDDTESINLNLMARLLEYEQPARVSLIVDACRSVAPADVTASGSGVLTRRLEAIPQDFEEDRFRAAGFGKEAYMLGTEPPRCLFSSVVLYSLAGKAPDAAEVRGEAQVLTSRGLARAIQGAMRTQAARFRLRATPSLRPGFFTDDVYVRLPIGYEPPPLPQPPAAAPAEAPADPGPAHADRLERVRKPLKRVFVDDDAPGGAEERFTVDLDLNLTDLPPPVPSARTPPRPGPIDFTIESTASVVPSQIHLSLHTSDDRAMSLVLDADERRHVGALEPWQKGKAAAEPRIALVEGDRLGDATAAGAASFVLRLPDGRSVGGARFGEATAYVSVGPHGEIAVIHRRPEGPAEVERFKETVVNRLIAGRSLRRMVPRMARAVAETADPTLGVVCAYMLEATGDRRAIRSLAEAFEPARIIPFDLALLADLEGERRHGALRARLTANGAWLAVAGTFPWLRQGWPLLHAARLPLAPELLELRPVLRRSPFTVFDDRTAEVVAHLMLYGDL